MDDTYILNKLKSWAQLFYGEENSKYSFAKKDGEYFIFGYSKKNDEKINRITKALAIYLSIGMLHLKRIDEKPVIVQQAAKPDNVKRKRKNDPEIEAVKTGLRIKKIPKKIKPKTKRFNLFGE